jgi:hypothetical protein
MSNSPMPAGRSLSPKVLACPDCGTPIDSEAQTCAGCGRVVERPGTLIEEDAPVSKVLGPTGAGAWLVLAVLLVVVVGGPIFWWRSQYAHVPKPETEAQQILRLRSEAEGEMLKECTNVVVGLSRVIHSSIADLSDSPYRWSGDLTVEFVNRVGGIERTNLFFKFGTDTGGDGLVHLRCVSESEADRKARQRNEKRAAERVGR